MLMKIKRESTEVENMYLPEFKTFKKKRSIEKGRLSIFIIGGFLLLFLGLLTFEFRYLSFEDNASKILLNSLAKTPINLNETKILLKNLVY